MRLLGQSFGEAMSHVRAPKSRTHIRRCCQQIAVKYGVQLQRNGHKHRFEDIFIFSILPMYKENHSTILFVLSGMMFAGYDKRGANLYYIDSEGTRTPGKVFSVGSGSIFAYGVLDSGYKFDLTNEEARELGRRAIYHATHRDAASGGLVRGER